MERSGTSGDPGVRVLVAFESRKGSTREIVETIAAEINTAGWDVDVIEIKDSPRPDEYGYVIIGGPLHMGKIKGVRNFVDMRNLKGVRPTQLTLAGFSVQNGGK